MFYINKYLTISTKNSFSKSRKYSEVEGRDVRHSPKAFSQAATSQMFYFPSSKRPNLTFGKLPLGILSLGIIVTWDIVNWEMPLGKYLTRKQRSWNLYQCFVRQNLRFLFWDQHFCLRGSNYSQQILIYLRFTQSGCKDIIIR